MGVMLAKFLHVRSKRVSAVKNLWCLPSSLPSLAICCSDNVAVLPAAQGRGIGARLLALAEEQARGLGLREIRLYTNEAMTENLAYYPRHGYAETHRAKQDGFNRVFFRKPID